MRKSTLHFLMALFLLAGSQAFAGKMRSHMLFSAKLDGAQETPAVSTSANGVASFVLNSTRDTLCINMSFAGLSGSPTGVHIHSGAMGVAGPVLVDLSSFVVGNRLVATLTGTAVSAAIRASMLRGMTYINVHTAANAGGEIRGQIKLESDMAFVGAMDGAQATPSVSTTANGYAVFNVAQHQGSVKFYVVTNGLSGAITSAHLHVGAAGVSGPVIQDLSTYISGNVLTGVFTPSANVIADLMAGTAYINIHTSANPGGEIRGQLKMDDKIAFDAWMDGAQEVPSVATSAKGLTSLRLNVTMDTLWYNVYTTGLSGAITSAHLHTGAPGIAGPVAAAFGTASGNMISGTITGASLNMTLINNMLTGNIYSNVHTATNAGGEIRGQVWRVMREGYTISMDGSQETPATTSTAKGAGIVSINRDWDNAHYMISSSGVTPTGMHFHKNAMGVAGAVVDDISTVYSNNLTAGYWKTTDTSPFSPFTTTLANSIDNDSVYVNMHTSANPGGEIRGQVLHGFKCYSMPTGIATLAGITDKGVMVYPNPASGSFNLWIGTESSESINVSVYDMIGRSVTSASYDLHTGDNSFRLDVKNAPAGMYFVKVSNGKQEVIKKLIIE